MDVRLSPEQTALRDSVVQVTDRLAPHAVGELGDTERIAKLDATVTAAGWRELRAAADDGATSAGTPAPLASAVEVALVAEELGRGLADVPFLGPTLAQELRRLAGAPAATSAETVALTPDLAAPAATTDAAVAVDALGATNALVLVPRSGGHTLATVRLRGEPGGVDLTRPGLTLAGDARLDPVPDQGRVIGDDDLARWAALGLALASADLVGTMAGATELACEYAKERRQYGTAIGSFQAVQHLLADAFVATEGSRSTTLHAAWAVDALPVAEAGAAAAVAKAYCARASRAVCETSIQVHGGIGNTWECLAHVYARRALLSADVLGGVGACLARVLDHHGIGGERGLR